MQNEGCGQPLHAKDQNTNLNLKRFFPKSRGPLQMDYIIMLPDINVLSHYIICYQIWISFSHDP